MPVIINQRAALGWLVILAALTIGALVVALGQVSHQAVRQGESRRAATAANTAAFWSCHSTHIRELRESCLAQLNPPKLAPSSFPPPEGDLRELGNHNVDRLDRIADRSHADLVPQP